MAKVEQAFRLKKTLKTNYCVPYLFSNFPGVIRVEQLPASIMMPEEVLFHGNFSASKWPKLKG